MQVRIAMITRRTHHFILAFVQSDLVQKVEQEVGDIKPKVAKLVDRQQKVDGIDPEEPDAFADTVKVYNNPFVRPDIKIGLDEPIVSILPGFEITV